MTILSDKTFYKSPTLAVIMHLAKEIKHGGAEMKKKWYQGTIGEDLPITVAVSVAWCLTLAGIIAEVLYVYR